MLDLGFYVKNVSFFAMCSMWLLKILVTQTHS